MHKDSKEEKEDEFPSLAHYPKGKAGEPHCWDDIDISEMKLRGKTYLEDKVKIKAKRPLFKLVNADLFYSKEMFDNFAESEHSYVSRLEKQGDNRFKFCIMMQFPPEHMMTTWVLDLDDIEKGEGTRKRSNDDEGESKDKEEELYRTFNNIDHNFATLWKKWLASNDTNKDHRLKLLPRVVTGGFMIRHALSTGKPTILGTKMKCKYFNKINTDKHYFEIDCDVHSSEIAKKLIGLIKKYAKDLSFDCAFILEGADPSELPERIFAGINFSKVDVQKGRVLEGVDPGHP